MKQRTKVNTNCQLTVQLFGDAVGVGRCVYQQGALPVKMLSVAVHRGQKRKKHLPAERRRAGAYRLITSSNKKVYARQLVSLNSRLVVRVWRLLSFFRDWQVIFLLIFFA